MTVRTAGMFRSRRILISGTTSCTGSLLLSKRGLVSDGDESACRPSFALTLAGRVYGNGSVQPHRSKTRLTSSKKTLINTTQRSAYPAAAAQGKKNGNSRKNAFLPIQLPGYCSAGWESVAPTSGPMMMERSHPIDHSG
jgi:hypothetical protein